MKTQVPHDEPPIAEWKWPVILSLYDRSPLDPTEIEVLDRVRERPGREKKRAAVGRSIQLSLQRLITPINDCLDYTQAHSFSRGLVISVLIREMQRRHSTFWEWASSEWLETLCVDGNAFRRLHKAPNSCRLDLMAVAYLLCEIKDFHDAGRFSQKRVAKKVFGAQRVNEATQQLLAAVRSQGYGGSRATNSFPALIAELLLINRSPHLSDLTPELLEGMRSGKMANRLKNEILLISKALTGLGIFKQPLARSQKQPQVGARGAFQDVPDEWIEWCVRWKNTSTLSPASRWRIYYLVQKVGRWLTAHHPEITSPTQWTRETAVEFVAAVSRMNVGDYSYPHANIRDRIGKPMTPRAKATSIAGIRTFFTDLQEWDRYSF